MRNYIARRLLLMIPTLLLVSIIVFLSIRLIPGEVVEQMALQMGQRTQGEGEPVNVEALRATLGLDVPWHVQYARWMGMWPHNEWGGRTESSVSDLAVTQNKTAAGETDSIRAKVSNVGDTASDYHVTLKLDDATLQTRTITLEPGASDVVTFNTSSSTEGTYSIGADGFSNFSGIFQFDFGESLWARRDVLADIISRLPVTFELGLLAFIIAQVIAIPIGIYSAIRQDGMGDFLGRTFAIVSLATPAFWLATMIMVFPSIWWGWSPPMVYTTFAEDPTENLVQFLIPAALMGTAMSATTMRMLRTTMLEVLRQDYVRTAWSKGLKERVIVTRHAMRNALIPVITIVSGQIPIMIGGAVIMEQIFNLPGMGRLFLDSINRRDYPFISGINILLAGFGLFLILLVDLSYAWLDPRIRYR